MEPAKIAVVMSKLTEIKLQILSMITHDGATAEDIGKKFNITNPAALGHLNDLASVGLLEREKERRKLGAPQYRFFPRNFHLIVKVNSGKFSATLEFEPR